MSNIDAVLITINCIQHIPFIKRAGPILSPISVTVGVANNLKALGFPVVIHESRVVDNLELDTDAVTVEEQQELDEFVEEVVTEDRAIDVNPSSAPETLTSDEPLEVLSEDDSGEEENEEEVSEEEEEVSLEVYPIAHYSNWNKGKLVKYLQKAAEFLTEEEVNSLETLIKKDLIALIKLRLLSEAE